MNGSKKRTVRISTILFVAGAVLGVASVFLAWFDVSTPTGHMTVSGLDVFNEFHDLGVLMFLPLAVLILSAVMFIPTYLDFRRARGFAQGALPGAMVMELVYLYCSTNEHYDVFRIADHLGIGVYAAALAGILMFVGGICSIIGNWLSKRKAAGTK